MEQKIKIMQKAWHVISTVLSVLLVPSEKIILGHLRKFSNQHKFSDRSFAKYLRDKINILIDRMNIKNLSMEDSFLFLYSRSASRYGNQNFTFKYRLPRISIGYDCSNKAETYYKFYKGVIDTCIKEFHTL